jgi:signal transduction histidine kinase
MEIVTQALSGQAILKVDDTYEYYQIYEAGDELLLDFE